MRTKSRREIPSQCGRVDCGPNRVSMVFNRFGLAVGDDQSAADVNVMYCERSVQRIRSRLSSEFRAKPPLFFAPQCLALGRKLLAGRELWRNAKQHMAGVV